MARVLVLDDDALFLALMRRALEKRGHDVCAVSSVQAARDAVVEPFDVLVCDVVLPEESGLALMRDMRAQFPGMTIVAVSGGTANGKRIAIDVLHVAQVTCADAVVKKPFELANFVKTVEDALAGNRRLAGAHAL